MVQIKKYINNYNLEDDAFDAKLQESKIIYDNNNNNNNNNDINITTISNITRGIYYCFCII